MTRPDLHMEVVDVDDGCGVIHKDVQKLIVTRDLNFQVFQEARQELLNLVAYGEWA